MWILLLLGLHIMLLCLLRAGWGSRVMVCKQAGTLVQAAGHKGCHFCMHRPPIKPCRTEGCKGAMCARSAGFTSTPMLIVHTSLVDGFHSVDAGKLAVLCLVACHRVGVVLLSQLHALVDRLLLAAKLKTVCGRVRRCCTKHLATVAPYAPEAAWRKCAQGYCPKCAPGPLLAAVTWVLNHSPADYTGLEPFAVLALQHGLGSSCCCVLRWSSVRHKTQLYRMLCAMLA